VKMPGVLTTRKVLLVPNWCLSPRTRFQGFEAVEGEGENCIRNSC